MKHGTKPRDVTISILKLETLFKSTLLSPACFGCNISTVYILPPQEAGPSIKRTKTSDDSGLDMDNAAENGGGDSVIDGGASEIELVFRPHPTLMEKDDSHNR